MDTTDKIALVERFFSAYNDLDLTTLETLLDEDVYWEHHNRFQGRGRQALLESIGNFHTLLPDRRFGEIVRWAVNGDIVYVEHTATATPSITNEELKLQAGVEKSLDCVSVFVLCDGRVTEWSDYG